MALFTATAHYLVCHVEHNIPLQDTKEFISGHFGIVECLSVHDLVLLWLCQTKHMTCGKTS